MKRSVVWIPILIAICLFISSSALPGRQGQVPDSQSIRKELKILRGLDLKQDIPWSHKSREELLKIFNSEIRNNKSRDELVGSSAFLAWMHLVPEGFDLSAFFGSYFAESVSGFYLPGTKTLYLSRDKAASEIPSALSASGFDAQKITALHEMDRALQDQYFDLTKLLNCGRESGNDDISTALLSLIEGDAAYVTLDGIFKEMNQDLLSARNLDSLIPMLFAGVSARKSKPLPPFLVSSISAPHTEGFHFIKDVILCGGWDLVNAVYGDLPDSTEQILHPEKYLVERDFPYTIKMASIADELPEGWKKLEQNTVGELRLKIIFNSFFPSHNRNSSYEGWGGDTYSIYKRENEYFTIWITLWDSPKDANEFFDGYARVLKRKYSGLKIKKETKSIFDGNTGNKSVSMESRDKTVFIMEGVPSSLAAFLKDRLISSNVERKEHTVKVKVKELKKQTGSAPSGSAIAGTSGARIEFNMYTNGYYGFSVQKPSSWIFKPAQYSSRTPLTVGNLDTGAFVTFQIIPSDSAVTQDVIELNLTAFSTRMLNGFSKTGKGTKSIGGNTFYFIRGAGTDRSTKVATSLTAYGASIQKRVFVIFYLVPRDKEADSEYDINSVIQSVRFI